MNYIETTNILEVDENKQMAPRNWIPERSWKNYNNYSEIPATTCTEISEVTISQSKMGEISLNSSRNSQTGQTSGLHRVRSHTKK